MLFSFYSVAIGHMPLSIYNQALQNGFAFHLCTIYQHSNTIIIYIFCSQLDPTSEFLNLPRKPTLKKMYFLHLTSHPFPATCYQFFFPLIKEAPSQSQTSQCVNVYAHRTYFLTYLWILPTSVFMEVFTVHERKTCRERLSTFTPRHPVELYTQPTIGLILYVFVWLFDWYPSCN